MAWRTSCTVVYFTQANSWLLDKRQKTAAPLQFVKQCEGCLSRIGCLFNSQKLLSCFGNTTSKSFVCIINFAAFIWICEQSKNKEKRKKKQQEAAANTLCILEDTLNLITAILWSGNNRLESLPQKSSDVQTKGREQKIPTIIWHTTCLLRLLLKSIPGLVHLNSSNCQCGPCNTIWCDDVFPYCPDEPWRQQSMTANRKVLYVESSVTLCKRVNGQGD